MTLPIDTPLLSILIPTKNRYETLVPVVIRIAASIGDPRLEIVICDNSTQCSDQVDALIATDPRITYHYFPDDVSIVDNTERGIDLCHGQYICFIGDDDLVSPHIMAVTDWLKDSDEDCLVYPPARWWWQSVRFAKETRSQRPGIFWLPKARDGTVRRLDSTNELDRVLARGGVALMNLPRLYHGIVSRHAVGRIRQRFGRYVPGASPDMALCVALALTNESYLAIDYPVTVFGASRNSGGGWTAARQHHGRIEDQKHLPRDILDRWDPRLPRIWSEQIIYPQTIHEVLSYAGVDNTLSITTLYGSLMAYEPHILRHLLPILVRHGRNHPTDIGAIMYKTMVKLAGRLRVTVRGKTGVGMPFDFNVLPDVAAVMTFLAALPAPTLPAVPAPAN